LKKLPPDVITEVDLEEETETEAVTEVVTENQDQNRCVSLSETTVNALVEIADSILVAKLTDN